jgi:hypothetical protein
MNDLTGARQLFAQKHIDHTRPTNTRSHGNEAGMLVHHFVNLVKLQPAPGAR